MESSQATISNAASGHTLTPDDELTQASKNTMRPPRGTVLISKNDAITDHYVVEERTQSYHTRYRGLIVPFICGSRLATGLIASLLIRYKFGRVIA